MDINTALLTMGRLYGRMCPCHHGTAMVANTPMAPNAPTHRHPDKATRRTAVAPPRGRMPHGTDARPAKHPLQPARREEPKPPDAGGLHDDLLPRLPEATNSTHRRPPFRQRRAHLFPHQAGFAKQTDSPKHGHHAQQRDKDKQRLRQKLKGLPADEDLTRWLQLLGEPLDKLPPGYMMFLGEHSAEDKETKIR